ncbi:MAG: cupin [Haliea sp.]|jgi:anti-sigma factor ChrR (cupin superfamily)|nr:cupin [Haliea sp.]
MINMDFNEHVVIHTADRDWVASPMAGVWRKPLAREEAERGHATSIVRYEPGARFSPHDHPQGEEILVLEGIFSDETGDYPAGTYFRNPEGFRHAPFSEEGCVILVKLHQFQVDDKDHVVIDTNSAEFQPGQGNLQVLPLHQHGGEQVALVHWPAGERFQEHSHFGGEEIYVISGELKDEHGSYPTGTWIRSPHLSRHHPYAEVDTLIWVKVGHLA